MKMLLLLNIKYDQYDQYDIYETISSNLRIYYLPYMIVYLREKWDLSNSKSSKNIIKNTKLFLSLYKSSVCAISLFQRV